MKYLTSFLFLVSLSAMAVDLPMISGSGFLTNQTTNVWLVPVGINTNSGTIAQLSIANSKSNLAGIVVTASFQQNSANGSNFVAYVETNGVPIFAVSGQGALSTYSNGVAVVQTDTTGRLASQTAVGTSNNFGSLMLGASNAAPVIGQLGAANAGGRLWVSNNGVLFYTFYSNNVANTFRVSLQ